MSIFEQNRTLRFIVTALACALVLFVVVWTESRTKSVGTTAGEGLGGRQVTPKSSLGVTFAGNAVQVRRVVDQYGNCSALAPANWVVTGSIATGNAVDIAASDGRALANYMISGVSGDATQSQFYPHFRSPETLLHWKLSGHGKVQVSYGEPISDPFGYTWIPFERADGYAGIAQTRVWRIPGDPRGYILQDRQAVTTKALWQSRGAEAILVALSIRCVAQLRSSGSDGSRAEDKEESTYNRELNMEYVHDPDTGELYWVSPSTDWHEVGPDGPGYYKQSGNELKKLASGLGQR